MNVGNDEFKILVSPEPYLLDILVVLSAVSVIFIINQKTYL